MWCHYQQIVYISSFIAYLCDSEDEDEEDGDEEGDEEGEEEEGEDPAEGVAESIEAAATWVLSYISQMLNIGTNSHWRVV